MFGDFRLLRQNFLYNYNIKTGIFNAFKSLDNIIC